MAKRDSNSEAPKVSNLPLPISDTPLVIDLPDGQKIVIGKMQTGSVIEVATWRGTGRPDSRTNRLMMGMNSAESLPTPQSSEAASASEAAKPVPNTLKTRLLGLFAGIRTQSGLFLTKIIGKIKRAKPTAISVKEADPRVADSLDSATEVDEWLQRLLDRTDNSTKNAAVVKKSASAKNAAVVKKPASAKRPAVVKKSASAKSKKK